MPILLGQKDGTFWGVGNLHQEVKTKKGNGNKTIKVNAQPAKKSVRGVRVYVTPQGHFPREPTKKGCFAGNDRTQQQGEKGRFEGKGSSQYDGSKEALSAARHYK